MTTDKTPEEADPKSSDGKLSSGDIESIVKQVNNINNIFKGAYLFAIVKMLLTY